MVVIEVLFLFGDCANQTQISAEDNYRDTGSMLSYGTPMSHTDSRETDTRLAASFPGQPGQASTRKKG